MADVNLKALAAARPFGAARKALIQAGCWDEHGDGDPGEYEVTLAGTARLTARLKVQARSEEEAEEIACRKAENWSASDWDMDYIDADDIEVEDCERLASAEQPQQGQP